MEDDQCHHTSFFFSDSLLCVRNFGFRQYSTFIQPGVGACVVLGALLAVFDGSGMLFAYETVPEGDLDQWCGATGKPSATGIPCKERNHSEDDINRCF